MSTISYHLLVVLVIQCLSFNRLISQAWVLSVSAAEILSYVTCVLYCLYNVVEELPTVLI